LRNHTLYNFKISDIPMACSSDGVAQDGENHSIYVNDISSKTTFQKFAHEVNIIFKKVLFYFK